MTPIANLESIHLDLPVCVNDQQHYMTIKHLLQNVSPVASKTRSLAVLEHFIRFKTLMVLAIVNEQQIPIGLMERSRITEEFSKPFAKDLLHKQCITELMNAAPVILDVNTSIDDAAKIIIASDMHHMVTGFIVVQNGIYAGIVSGHAMLEAITVRKQNELFFLAHYDQLTRIPNRTLFKDRLTMSCLNSKRNQTSIALIYIDLDRFKLINDSFGHSYGDQLLVTIAKRLADSVRDGDTVARLGGDEFVIILQNIVDTTHVLKVIDKLLPKIHAPILLFEHEVHIRASLGIALFPEHAETADVLIRNADLAMYQAKKHENYDYYIYSKDIESDRIERDVLIAALNNALVSEEFTMAYQPQYHLQHNTVIGVEALIRWNHPELGIISPAKFIPLAEQSGLIIKIGEWVIREVCRQHTRWIQQCLPPIRIAINISAKHFHQADFCCFLQNTLAAAHIDSSAIELELTESMMMINVESAIDSMHKLKNLGFKIAIDDFGTGFSSLSYLRRFPIDLIKIDQSFVRNIDSTPANEAIVSAIMALGKNLGLEMIAEGIETLEELTTIRKHGCEAAQGYYFAKPMTAEVFITWYNQQISDCNFIS